MNGGATRKAAGSRINAVMEAMSPEQQLHELLERLNALAPHLSQASLQGAAARVSALAAAHAEDSGSVGWTAGEDGVLRAAVGEHGHRWQLVAESLPGRSARSSRDRWSRISQLESGDNANMSLVALPLSALSPSALSPSALSPSALSPPMLMMTSQSWQSEGNARSWGQEEAPPKKTPRNGHGWTQEEDSILRAAVSAHGCRWVQIAPLLPGRSERAVRDRWTRLGP